MPSIEGKARPGKGKGTVDGKSPAPGSPHGIFQRDAEVIAHHPAGGRYFLLRLRCPDIAAAARPGQFVMLSVSPSLDPLLPRPLAVMDVRPAADRPAESAAPSDFDLLYVVAGRGTAMLRDRAETGIGIARFRVLGPLGRGFSIREDAGHHVLVGGGCGVAPLIFLAKKIAASGAGATLILGAKDAGGLLDRETMDAIPRCVRIVEATEDGSRGEKGTAVDALARLLDGTLSGRRAAVCASGPEGMLRAIHAMARARAFPCQLSLEARMACGMGVCRSCVVDGRAPHPETGLMRRAVCADGPVFDAEELAW
ncbi:MAG: dihydroorotate dehydrogenase electron transfer subunit [Planctomycetota bacterium]|nr:dihydroorotate dehydrogenase electron transfer subunit [Planctomycetota bacterium]